VGLYTSPHLSDFRERIRILNPKSEIRNQKQIRNPKSEIANKIQLEGMISRQKLADLVERLKPAIEKYNKVSKYGPLSFFEVYTALAFVYFKEQDPDFVVLETGLGGRLDATNTVDALVSVITPISYEHTQKLGNTLTEIAGEKAGIIKSRKSAVISALQEKEARDVIRNRCKKIGAKLQEINDPLRNKQVGLIGRHQRMNAAVAVAAVRALGLGISKKVIDKGLKQTRWPGRCEVVSKNPLVILDGAQNIASAKAIKDTVRENFRYKKLILALGISKDKDISGICGQLHDLADKVILTKADNPRAAAPEYLAGCFADKPTYITHSVKEAKRLAKELAKTSDLVLVTGSLFVVGEFKDA
jgi:dihydrofolate synthase/folylpolyglutamate synthase